MNSQNKSEETVSIKEFVILLWKGFLKNKKEISKNSPLLNSPNNDFSIPLLHYGHIKGWLEDFDEVNADSPIDKRTAARILHQFMKIELGIPDFANIHEAETLKDLYSCRVCVNHIAQIYLRKIMPAEEIESNGNIYYIFNMLNQISLSEAEKFINKIFSINK